MKEDVVTNHWMTSIGADGCPGLQLVSAMLASSAPLPVMSGAAAMAARVSTAVGVTTAKASAASETLRRMPATAGVESTPSFAAETLLRVPATEPVQSAGVT